MISYITNLVPPFPNTGARKCCNVSPLPHRIPFEMKI